MCRVAAVRKMELLGRARVMATGARERLLRRRRQLGKGQLGEKRVREEPSTKKKLFSLS